MTIIKKKKTIENQKKEIKKQSNPNRIRFN